MFNYVFLFQSDDTTPHWINYFFVKTIRKKTMRKLYPGQYENMILRTKNECRYLTPTFHSRQNSNHINGYWLNGLRRSEKIALLCANHLCVSKYNCTMLHLFDDLWLDKIFVFCSQYHVFVLPWVKFPHSSTNARSLGEGYKYETN
jgi:hypothetical protein